VYPTIEFYAQCVDVNINPTGNAVAVDSIVKYSITSPKIYPDNGNDGVGFRNPYNTAQGMTEQYMTGPPCAGGYNGNSCALTADGTTGFVSVGDTTTITSSGGGGGNSGSGANNNLSGEGGGGGSPIVLILGFSALLMALAAGGVFMWKRKKTTEAAKLADNLYPVAPAATNAKPVTRRPPPPPPIKKVKGDAAWQV